MILGILLEGLLVRLPANPAGAALPGERIGVLHIHTRASDGSGTLPEIVADARQAGLSFVAITDHNVSMAKSVAGDFGPDFAVIEGEELTTWSGHLLTLGIAPGWQRLKPFDPDALMEATHAAGGYNIPAHPFHDRVPWTDWKTSNSNIDGLEILNGDTSWRQANFLDLMTALVLYTVNDQLALVRMARTPDRELAKWDELSAQKPIPGFCGSDAHAALRLGMGFIWRFPGYTPLFRVSRTHVLLPPDAGGGDPNHASASEILDALMSGHSFCALDALYPASGFVQRISTGSAVGGPGDNLTWGNSGRIHVSVPTGASQPMIKVIRDGKEFLSKMAWTVDEPIPGPGRYRSEVFLRQPGLTGWKRWTPWILSNPIYVNPPPGEPTAIN